MILKKIYYFQIQYELVSESIKHSEKKLISHLTFFLNFFDITKHQIVFRKSKSTYSVYIHTLFSLV